MFKTVRARLTLWYIALLVLILIAFSGALYFTLARALYQRVDDSLSLNAHELANGVNVINGQIVLPGDQNDIGDRNVLRAQGYLVRILDTEGKVLDTNSTYAPLPIAPDALAMARRALMPVDQITRSAQRISARDLSQRLNLNLPSGAAIESSRG